METMAREKKEGQRHKNIKIIFFGKTGEWQVALYGVTICLMMTHSINTAWTMLADIAH